MTEELAIDFVMVGLDDALESVVALSRAIARLPAAVKIKLVADGSAVSKITASKGSVGANGPAAADPLKALVNQSAIVKAQQTFSKLTKSQMNVALSKIPAGQGSSPAWLNAAATYAKLQSPNRGGVGSALMGVLKSSRFGRSASGGVSLMPLVGQTISALGKAGPVGMAIAAAAVALSSLVTAAVGAANALREMAANKTLTGASFSNAGRMQTAGAAFGMDSGSVADAASSLAGQLASNPMAAGRLGVNDVMGDNPLFGRHDQAQTFFDSLKQMTKMSDEEIERITRALPALRPFASINHMAPDVQSTLLDNVNSMFSPEKRAAAQQYSDATSRIAMQWQGLKQAFGETAIPALTMAFNGLNAVVVQLERSAYDAMATIHNLFSKNKMKSWDELTKNRDDAAKLHQDALDRNTASIDDLTDTMSRDRRMYGGGQRANSAIPSRYNQMSGTPIRFGAFGYQ